MLPLSPNQSFHFELIRQLGMSYFKGSDVGEILQLCEKIKPGDVESWYEEFYALAIHVNSKAKAIDAERFPVSAREAYFRAATYFRASEFYIHANRQDPRIYDAWDKQTAAFDKAIALLPVPGERVTLRPTKGSYNYSGIFFRAQGASDTSKRPTIIAHIGFDGSQEEMYHAVGVAALERGYNVLTFDGPGQGVTLRKEHAFFVKEWEQVVTPAVDYVLAQPEADPKRIGLLGFSMSGFHTIRAAAFEHRLAAAMPIDGVYDIKAAFDGFLSPEMKAAFDSGDVEKTNKLVQACIDSNQNTVFKWAFEHGVYSFGASSPYDFVAMLHDWTLEGVANLVQCPTLIGDAEEDLFFGGQPEMVKEAMGEKGTLLVLTSEDAAQLHCHEGAGSFFTQQVYDWFDKVTASN